MITYFPTPAARITVKVRQYRDAIDFALYCYGKASQPSCTRRELIQERSSSLIALMRAMRDLQGMHCPRAAQDDKERYEYALSHATECLDKHWEEYFFHQPSSAHTDEQLENNWLMSRKADQLTYLKNPTDYPAQHQAVLRELKIAA